MYKRDNINDDDAYSDDVCGAGTCGGRCSFRNDMKPTAVTFA